MEGSAMSYRAVLVPLGTTGAVAPEVAALLDRSKRQWCGDVCACVGVAHSLQVNLQDGKEECGDGCMYLYRGWGAHSLHFLQGDKKGEKTRCWENVESTVDEKHT